MLKPRTEKNEMISLVAFVGNKNTNEDWTRKSDSYTERWQNRNRSWHRVTRNRKKIKTSIERKNDGKCNEPGYKNPLFFCKAKIMQLRKNGLNLTLLIGENTWNYHESKERGKLILTLFLFSTIFFILVDFSAFTAALLTWFDLFSPP